MPTYLSPGVYVHEVDAATRPIEGVGTAVAAFVGVAPDGPQNQPTLVSNWTQYVDTFGGLYAGAYLAYAVYGYFLNGGGNCYIVRIGTSEQGPGRESKKEKDAKSVNAAPTVTIGGYAITAKSAAANAKPVKVEVGPAGGEAPAEDEFKVSVILEGRAPEVWENVSTKPGTENYIVTKVSSESKLVTVTEVAQGAALKPATGTFDLAVPEPAPQPLAVDRLRAADYIGDPADRTGFGGLQEIEEVTMVAVPDLMAAYQQGAIDLETVQAVQSAMVAHCELMGDRLAILDPPPGLSAQGITTWRADAAHDSKYATLYYPWIKVLDPMSGTNQFVPPSGHIAGVWARNDNDRGVHKAPANEIIRGVVAVETQLTRIEQELLNPVGINAIRKFPGQGIRVWGARTLSSDAAWRYVNVRRLFNYLEKSILGATQFAVFEPNDAALWGKLRRSISSFLLNEWRKGALFGRTPEEAFFVKCDEETNPPEIVDAGQVICQIGVAPVKPAEFVVFELSQFSGGTSIVTE
ncbi:phage tail sheath family protein [Microbacterium sp. dk485]|uniref:phage tail sheath family protein n=1 Tax=Microbacterium sp. dk485 TaxID=2560021 RepID=UPI00107342BA|nr:phage tail sheath subtilisin-like domain-containing protein [Microbacterium sp. dk485]TFV81746.1 phage tail sheath family protein [Microbacterium sp. dk485]